MSREEQVLKQLEYKFLEAIKADQDNNIDKAQQIYKAILTVEPRLVEPNLELSNIAIRRGRFDEAQVYAEEAIRLCELHGHWLENFTDNQLQSMAYVLLGESIREQAQQDEIVFNNPTLFNELITKAKEAYQRAAKIDPNNEFARHWGGHDPDWKSQ